MARPKPKKSNLANLSPMRAAAPVAGEGSEPQPPQPANITRIQRETPEPTVRQRSPAQTPTPESPPEAKTKTSFYHSRSDAIRAKAAYLQTSSREGITWSDHINHALMAYTQQLEDTHNGGKPFPATVENIAPGRRASL